MVMVMDWRAEAQRVDDFVGQIASHGMGPLGVNLTIPSPMVVEALGHLGVRWIIIDQEHTEISGSGELSALLRAGALTHMICIVKVDAPEGRLIRAALDAGAHGVMVPFVDTPAQLRSILAAAHFPPVGERGFCSVMRAVAYSTAHATGKQEALSRAFVEFSNEHALVIPTVESKLAVQNLEALAAVEECPLWHVGLSDLALQVSPRADPDWALARRVSGAVVRVLRAQGRHTVGAVAPHELGESKSWADVPYVVDVECLAAGLPSGAL